MKQSGNEMKRRSSSDKGSLRSRRPFLPTREADFAEVIGLIQAARQRAYSSVNKELVGLYWQIGEFISRKLESAQWGDAVVADLGRHIQRRHPNLRGFTRASLFRMRQFFDLYRADKKVAPLVRQLSWSHHLIIMGGCKRPEEREFYIFCSSIEGSIVSWQSN